MVWAPLALLLIGAALLAMIGMAMAAMLRKERTLDETLHDPLTPTVTWIVPPGVDPVIIGGELTAAGYPNSLEERAGMTTLCISCPPGRRSSVRSIIEAVELEQYSPALDLPPVLFREDAS
ncbi:hypothetical protein [Nocardioides jiangxiensis]|uniref:Uncharacterized protein n=1 Tax=Nocardioides jiangxiensis TaxID=3064524 RepID=A0ABT9AZW1_9ACTN|nr:hypothetical protein [Nocardioides sp. WY-20]MDO7868137.1 hypothetical protein [Nocardioides sp. WY-20]